MRPLLGLFVLIVTPFAVRGIAKLHIILKSKASSMPAVRGLHGERLIRGTRAMLDWRWLSLTVLQFPALVLGALALQGLIGRWSYGLVLAVVAGAAAQLTAYLMLVSRFRLAIAKSGIRYRKWWERRARAMNWTDITTLGGSKYEDIIIESRDDRLRVPLGLCGRDELLDELMRHARAASWQPEFRAIVEKSHAAKQWNEAGLTLPRSRQR